MHLHPTRLCALACRHCYSESAPQQSAALDGGSVIRALSVLRAEGYVREALVDEVGPLLDGVAVSFDGLAATHDAMRGRPDAFARASATLQRIAALGHPVAAAISVTRDAIPELPDLVDHVVALGARAVQIRPVARAGRARTLDDAAHHSAADWARLYMVAFALAQEVPEGVRVHTDLAPAQGLWAQRAAYAGLLAGDCTVGGRSAVGLAELVNPLVVTDAGRLKPIAYDFDPRFDVGAVDALTPEALRAYKRERLPRCEALVADALASLQERQDLVDWFDYCTRASERAAG